MRFLWTLLFLTGVALAQATTPTPVNTPSTLTEASYENDNPDAVGKQAWKLKKPPLFLQEAWLGTNGYIDVAWLVANIPADSSLVNLHQTVFNMLDAAFNERPDLAEVDISIFPRGTTPIGFRTTPPLFTISVPKAELQTVRSLALNRTWLDQYNRVFYAAVPSLAVSKPRKALDYSLKASAQVQGVLLHRGSKRFPVTALTIDDAPHPLYTPLWIDLLKRVNLRATFFIIGRNAEAYPYFVQDFVKNNHEIAIHSYSHIPMDVMDTETLRWEISQTNLILERITGITPHFFRPPGGRYSKNIFPVLAAQKQTLALWTNDPGDFAPISPKLLIERLDRHLDAGGIILLHDNVDMTLEAMPDLIVLTQKAGLKLVTLGEMVYTNYTAQTL